MSVNLQKRASRLRKPDPVIVKIAHSSPSHRKRSRSMMGGRFRSMEQKNPAQPSSQSQKPASHIDDVYIEPATLSSQEVLIEWNNKPSHRRIFKIEDILTM